MGRLETLRVVDPVLTNIARGYSNDTFIGDNLFPVVNVDKEAGKIPTWGKEQFKVWATERALRANSNEMEGAWLDTIPFKTEEHDLVQPIDYRELEEAMLKLEVKAVDDVMAAINLRREILQATLAQDTGTYDTNNKITLTDDFLNESAIDPIDYIRKKMNTLAMLIGKDPNVCILGRKVWSIFAVHPKIKEYLNLSVNSQMIFQTVSTIQKILGIISLSSAVPFVAPLDRQTPASARRP